jgi:DNA polymerase III subunit alpha
MAKNKSFVHLHVHADGSALDGLSQVKKMVPRVIELGQTALAITDHGSMSATYDLYKATKGTDIKPIYGIEAYLAPAVPRTHKEPVRWASGGGDDVSGAGAYTHMTMWAETNEGLHNLFRLSSEAYLTGFYRKPRMDEELLRKYHKGIIATTGCPSGEVQTWLRIGDYEKAKAAAAKFAEIFGEGNFFVELMDHGLEIEKTVIPQLLQIAKELGLPTVATNDSHYTHKEDSHVHEALLCIGSGSKLSDDTRFKFDGDGYYLKTAEEMRAIWDHIAPDACDNTVLIAERCVANFEDGFNLMPEFPVPEGETESTWLMKEVMSGLHKRYPNGIPEDRIKQAEYEVGVINQMGFPGYFLVTADFINWAKEQGIRVGPGRGCLSGDSNILTPSGFKKIKDIKVNDEVYDEKGAIVKVPAVFEYDCAEPLIEIKGFYGGNGNKMTSDHKVLVSKDGATPPIWVRADEISLNDYLVKPAVLEGRALVKHTDADFLDDDFLYYKVKEIGFVPAEGKVYDFTVPTTNSYVTDSYVVHNSAAGSTVAYAMGITDIDPMRHGLMFERFLNPERVSMPDIDVDFDDRRRGEVIDYVIQKYGEDKVANITTFMSVKAKAAIKDATRVLGLPYILGDALTKVYPQPIVGRDLSLSDAYDPANERYDEAAEFRALAESTPDYKEIVKLAKGLEGVRRGHGMHAAGVIMSKKPLVETVPLMKRDTNSPVMTQFEYPTCEYLGLLKMDFLGLSNLGTLDETLRLIKQNKNVEVDLDKIGEDLNDTKTFEMVARGETLGVFQLDSPPMRSLLKLMEPDKFEDISAVLALYRPGPMGAGSHIEYAERKNKRRKVTPIHPELEKDLEPILGETYGLCVAGETVIWDANSGKRVRIDSIQESVNKGSFYTFGINDEGIVVKSKVSHFIPTGRKQVLKITTRNGRSIRLSEDHPMLTPRGWVNAGDLVAGVDRLAVPSSAFDTGNKSPMTPEEARFLGYLLGDGYINLDQNNFTNKDFELLNKVSRLAKEIFPDVYPVIRDRRNTASPSGKAYTSRVDFMASPEGTGRGNSSKNGVYKNLSINVWLKELGFKNKTLSANKFIPELVFASGNEAIIELLAGLWDSDGSVGNKAATLKTISRELATDVQDALTRLGILSTIYLSESFNSIVGKHAAYQVTVSDSRFWKLVTPRLASKHKRESVAPSYSRSQISNGINGSLMLNNLKELVLNDDSLPIGVRKRLQANGKISIKAATNYLNRSHGLAAATIPSLRLDGSYLPMNEISRTYLENYGTNEDFLYANQNWTIIDEIVEDGFDEMYDITVEGIHNFIANGFVSHNCIYQEQVMKVAQELAGYSLGKADLLRRAMGKKDPKILAQEFAPFRDGMRERGYSDPAIQSLWDVLVPFSDYAFNRAHTAGYGLVSYWTAYLKANFPAEYMAALLTTNADNKDKLALYLGECRRMGIKVLSPDVNMSELNYTAVGDDIRVGLVGVKNVGEKVISAWLAARKEKGKASSFADFLIKADGNLATKKSLESLIKAGAFDSFGHSRAALFTIVEDALKLSKKVIKNSAKDQVSLFDDDSLDFQLEIPEMEEWDKTEKLKLEREMLGLYVSDHPLGEYAEAISMLSTLSIADLRDAEHPPTDTIKLAGLVSAIDRKTTKKSGEPWALVTIEDLDSSINVFVFPKTYVEYGDLLKRDSVLVFTGKAEKRDDGSTSVIIRDISEPNLVLAQKKAERRAERVASGEITEAEAKSIPLVRQAIDEGNTNPIVIAVDESQLDVVKTTKLKDLLLEYSGTRPVHVRMKRTDGTYATFVLSSDYNATGTGELAAEIRALFGAEAV